MKAKPSRGGARPGAGRPSLGREKTLVAFSPETLKDLRQRAKAGGVSIGHVIESMIYPEGRPS